MRKVLWCCLGTVTVIGLGMGLLFRLLGPDLMSLYNSEPEVIANGLIRMDIIMPTYFLCGLMDVMVGQLRGIGFSVMPMVVSLTGACLLRIVWILTVFAQDHSLTILYLSYPVSWFVTFAIHFLCYHFAGRKRLRQRSKQHESCSPHGPGKTEERNAPEERLRARLRCCMLPVFRR